MPDPGSLEWLRDRMKGMPWPGRDGLRGVVLYDDAVAALEAREQATINRAVKLLRGAEPSIDAPWPLHDAADYLERELRPEGTDD